MPAAAPNPASPGWPAVSHAAASTIGNAVVWESSSVTAACCRREASPPRKFAVPYPQAAATAASAASTTSPGQGLDRPQQPPDVLGHHVDLEVDRVAHPLAAERRQPQRGRDQADCERGV